MPLEIQKVTFEVKGHEEDTPGLGALDLRKLQDADVSADVSAVDFENGISLQVWIDERMLLATNTKQRLFSMINLDSNATANFAVDCQHDDESNHTLTFSVPGEKG
jgi:hypothetical protein